MSLVGIAGGVGYVAVPVAVALETIGVPVPAETTLVAAAVLASQGKLNIELVILLALAMAHTPGRIERRVAELAAGAGRLRRPLVWLSEVLAHGGEGVRYALALVSRRPTILLGAVAWWAFDIATLAAGFHAFGNAPQVTVLVMGYFVGTLGNLLPLPGGVGGVEGGMIGAFVAFGQSASVALVAVLAYRLVSFWLPTAIGAPAYLALRRTLGSRPG